MQAQSQKHAQAVYELITKLKNKSHSSDKDFAKKLDKELKRYGALCHKFPLIVRENGLAAAFGFLHAKESTNKEYKNKDTGETQRYHSAEHYLLQHYAKLFHQFELAENDNYTEQHKKLISKDTSLQQYRRLTQQTLQLAEWFKRYAEGVLKVSADGTSKEEETEEEQSHA